MTELAVDQELEPEVEETEVEVEPEEPSSFEEQVREALVEETEPELVAPTEPEEEPEVAEEEPQASSQVETAEEQELRWARTIAAEIKANPQLGDALVALKQGKAQLLPTEVIEAARQAQQAQPEEPALDPEDDPFEYMRRLNQRVASQEEFYQQYEAQQRQAFENQQRQVYEQNQNLFFDTAEEYRRSHPELTDEDMVKIINSAAESSFVVKFKRQHGDNKRALTEAFEAARRVEFPQHIQTPEQVARNRKNKQRASAASASPRASQRLKPEEPNKRGWEGVKETLTELARDALEANS